MRGVGGVRGAAATALVPIAVASLAVTSLVACAVTTAPAPVPSTSPTPTHAAASAPTSFATRAVSEMLRRRGDALVAGDLPGFLATSGGGEIERAEATRTYTRVRALAVTSWRYEGVAVEGAVVTAKLRYRVGDSGGAVVPVTLTLAAASTPSSSGDAAGADHLRVVTESTAGAGREVWEVGDPHRTVVGSVQVIELDRDAASPRIDAAQVARRAAVAGDAVSRVWPRPWDRRVVVVVPGSTTELAQLLGRPPGGLDGVAALATSAPRGSSAGAARVWLDPEVWAGFSTRGQDLVLRHELTHLAVGDPAESRTPLWWEEGYAEYVALHESSLPDTRIAPELLAQVRAGGAPSRLPGDEELGAGSATAVLALQQAWWFVRGLARTYGDDALVRFHDAMLATVPSTASRDVFGADLDVLVERWRAELQSAAG